MAQLERRTGGMGGLYKALDCIYRGMDSTIAIEERAPRLGPRKFG